MIRTVLGIALLATLACAAPVAAQTQRAPAPVIAPPPTLQTPYEPQLLRLAEIMGALHYLIGLCQGPENSAWRREMQALLDAEATGGERRERLVQSFNRGYGGFEQAHRGCTPAARLATQRYVVEARRLVADLAGRYGN
ncbi:MAG: hypothetical protein FD152_4028 [Xanthobacteraceae bacterium]|nr:MAG: hypothetical protein FD152_4028 [Xanthobacteraceae bacterium]